MQLISSVRQPGGSKEAKPGTFRLTTGQQDQRTEQVWDLSKPLGGRPAATAEPPHGLCRVLLAKAKTPLGAVVGNGREG